MDFSTYVIADDFSTVSQDVHELRDAERIGEDHLLYRLTLVDEQ